MDQQICLIKIHKRNIKQIHYFGYYLYFFITEYLLHLLFIFFSVMQFSISLDHFSLIFSCISAYFTICLFQHFCFSYVSFLFFHLSLRHCYFCVLVFLVLSLKISLTPPLFLFLFYLLSLHHTPFLFLASPFQPDFIVGFHFIQPLTPQTISCSCFSFLVPAFPFILFVIPVFSLSSVTPLQNLSGICLISHLNPTLVNTTALCPRLQVSWVEDVATAVSGERPIKLYDEQGYAALRKVCMTWRVLYYYFLITSKSSLGFKHFTVFYP